MSKIRPTSQIDQDSATDGQVLTYDTTTSRWQPETPTVGTTLYAKKEFFVAAAGNNTLTLGATPYQGGLTVYVNGLLKREASGAGNYTISGSIVTFGTALALNDIVGYQLWSTVVAGAATLGGAIIVSDDFNRADSNTTPGSADTGQAWVVLAGTWGIASNRLRSHTIGAEALLHIDAADADVTIEATRALTGNSGGPAWRITDANNYWLWEHDGRVYKRVAGTYNTVFTGATLTDGDVVKIVTLGNVHDLYRNGVLYTSITDAFNSTATKHGFREINANARFDTYRVSG